MHACSQFFCSDITVCFWLHGWFTDTNLLTEDVIQDFFCRLQIRLIPCCVVLYCCQAISLFSEERKQGRGDLQQRSPAGLKLWMWLCCAVGCRVLDTQIFKHHLSIYVTYFTERLLLFCQIPLITFTVTHHSLICGHWAAPVEQLGLRALLKGTTVMLTRERQVLLFSSPSPRSESVTFWSKTHFSRSQLPQLWLFWYKSDIRHYIMLCFK